MQADQVIVHAAAVQALEAQVALPRLLHEERDRHLLARDPSMMELSEDTLYRLGSHG